MTDRPTIAISIGDPQGIGPEITRAALADPAVRAAARVLLFAHLSSSDSAHPQLEGEDIEFVSVSGDVERGGAPPTAWAGRASFACVEAAIAAAKLDAGAPGHVDAIVTAPIAKEAWHLAGVPFPGHTELLAERFESPRSAMLFVGPRLKVILATIHVALSRVPTLLTADKIFDCIELGAKACRELGTPMPRVAVCGLNPHAGEHGMFGDEDARVIAPAIERARAAGIDATGPWPGDTIFLAAANGGYDLVVAMYHDQGLIPVKLLDQKFAVNVTVGLSWKGRRIIRTSPAHGTAFDIAGRGKADPSSMISAILLAARMAGTRD